MVRLSQLPEASRTSLLNLECPVSNARCSTGAPGLKVLRSRNVESPSYRPLAFIDAAITSSAWGRGAYQASTESSRGIQTPTTL